jgi:hypothetical protein
VPGDDDLVWYVSYGSNMHAERLAQYLARARDPRPPRRDAAVWLPGSVYFATHSPVWGGGRAFYDPDLPGPAAARAWLIAATQFADIVAQEMYRDRGTDLDLNEVLSTGRAQLGTGRYETLLHVGERDGHPELTFTAPWHAADVDSVAPSPSYLAMLAGGLAEAHHWDAARTSDYLAHLRGAAGPPDA